MRCLGLSSRSGTRRKGQGGTGIVALVRKSILQKTIKYERTQLKKEKIIYIDSFLINLNFEII